MSSDPTAPPTHEFAFEDVDEPFALVEREADGTIEPRSHLVERYGHARGQLRRSCSSRGNDAAGI